MERDILWVEKYRPKELEDMVLSDEHCRQLEECISKGTIPHLLLVGVVGSGKTTIARILINKINCTHMELNASDERGIDTVRGRVKGFLMTQSMKDWKIVFMDEFDAATPDAQFSLRNMMERFSEKSRFILTANYEEKIIEPLRSRCQTLRFVKLDRKSVFKRAAHVLNAEQVEFDPEDVLKLVDDLYPDMRKVINTMQLNSSNNKFVYVSPVDALKEIKEALMKKDLRRIREVVANEKPDFVMLYRGLFDSLPNMKVEDRTLLGLTIAEYLYRDSIIADREVNFAACMLECMKNL